MTELTLELDQMANESIQKLMCHYGVKSKAEIFKKGLSLLQLAAYIDDTDGELLARKGQHETKIIVR